MPRKKHKISPRELANMERRVLPFEGEWERFMGQPEDRGVWLIWGQSYNGKTRLVLMLTKYIAELGEKVAVVSLEEGDGASMRRAFKEACMEAVNNRVSLWVEMDIEDIKRELRKQRSPKVVVIDSLQYLGINYKGYKQLKEEFPSKLFILVSHANEKNQPKGATAEQVKYDAMVKIQVSQFRAKANSRYGGGEVLTIWEEGARRCPAGAELESDGVDGQNGVDGLNGFNGQNYNTENNGDQNNE